MMHVSRTTCHHDGECRASDLVKVNQNWLVNTDFKLNRVTRSLPSSSRSKWFAWHAEIPWLVSWTRSTFMTKHALTSRPFLEFHHGIGISRKHCLTLRLTAASAVFRYLTRDKVYTDHWIQIVDQRVFVYPWLTSTNHPQSSNSHSPIWLSGY